MSVERLITADMNISEVIKRFPNTEKVFLKYKLHCVECELATTGTIRMGAQTHSVKDLETLLDDLNAAAAE